jgi:hypothetical protein
MPLAVCSQPQGVQDSLAAVFAPLAFQGYIKRRADPDVGEEIEVFLVSPDGLWRC